MLFDMFLKSYTLLILTFTSFCSGNSDICAPFEMKSEYLNKQLVGHSVAEISGYGHHECVKECMSLSVCKSIDYYGRNKTCKLNDVDSASVDISEFILLNGAAFSDISEFSSAIVGSCESRSCATNQRCFPDTDTYYCIDITCKSKPKVENGRVILGAPSKNKYLDTATVECNTGYIPGQLSVKCQASGIWEQATCVHVAVSDCKEILQSDPASVSGVYDVKLWNTGVTLSVYCDMDTDGGGWTLFQKRFDGETEFYRNLSEYVNGFGSIDGEHWLGLKYIQEITEQGHTELRIDMSKSDDAEAYETLQDFSLTGAEFTINLGTRSGTAGSASNGMSYNNGFKFSAFDHDVDTKSSNCAVERHSAWWHGSCTWANLNGRYCTPGTVCSDAQSGMSGLTHNGFAGYYSMKSSSMMIRRLN